MTIQPGHTVPRTSLPLVGGGQFDSHDTGGSAFSLLVVYRGYHCPKCRDQLQEIVAKLDDFAKIGVHVVAASSDPQDRAEMAVKEWELGPLPVAYGLDEATARDWGLFISTSRGKTSMGVEETNTFSEPGLFLIREDGTLYAAWIQTVPFARPKADELVSMVKFVREKDYPPRGTKLAA